MYISRQKNWGTRNFDSNFCLGVNRAAIERMHLLNSPFNSYYCSVNTCSKSFIYTKHFEVKNSRCPDFSGERCTLNAFLTDNYLEC